MLIFYSETVTEKCGMISGEDFCWISARGRFNDMALLCLKNINFKFETLRSPPLIFIRIA